jgi:DNA-binding NarL/FixJ family response regulator
MPGLDGLTVLERAREQDPDLLVCVVTSYKDDAYLHRALELGARGFVLKDDAGEYLLRGIDALLDGQTFISASFGSQEPKLPHPAADSEQLLQQLTRMELRVLHLVAEFLTSKEIAERLHISHRTVQNHRLNITRKLQLKGMHQLVQYATQHQAAVAALIAD